MAIKTLFGEGIGFGAIKDVVRLGFSGGAPVATGPWYVDSALGSDSNDGLTSLTPFATMGKVHAVGGSSQIVNGKNGSVFPEAYSVTGTAVVHQAYGAQVTTLGWRNRPRITGLTPTTGWSGTTPTDAYDKTGVTTKPTIVLVITSDGVIHPLTENTVSKASLVSTAVGGSGGQWFHTGTTLTICTPGGNPDSVGSVVKINGIIQTGALVTVTQDSSFNGWEFEGGYDQMVTTSHTGNVFTDCGVSSGGIATTGAGSIRSLTGAGTLTVQDSEFRDLFTDGVYTQNSLTCLVTRCTMKRFFVSGADGVQFSGDTGTYSGGSQFTMSYVEFQTGSQSIKGCCIVVDDGTGAAYYLADNVVVANDWGLMIGHNGSTGGANSLMLRNACTGSVRASPANDMFLIGTSAAGTVMAYNVVTGTYPSGASGMSYQNNVTRATGFVYFNTVFMVTGDWAFRVNGILTTGTVKDNIFWLATANTYVYAVLSGSSSVDSDYNTIGPEQALMVRWAGTTYTTLAAFQAGKTKDLHSQKNDPLLLAAPTLLTLGAGESLASLKVRIARMDGPQSTSPARKAGTSIAGYSDTFPNPPDQGAYQFGALGLGVPGDTGRRHRSRWLFHPFRRAR